MALQDPKPAPQATKKKKRKKRVKIGQAKADSTGLEGFVDCVNLTLPTRESQGDPQISSEPTEEIKHDISSLAARFTAWIRKQAASAQGETTPYFGVPGGKRPKRLGLNEEVQKSLIVIISDSLE